MATSDNSTHRTTDRHIDPAAAPSVAAPQLVGVTWRKSRASNPSGDCVELAGLGEGAVAMRNSRDPQGPALIYTRSEIVAFLRGAKDGDFDDLIA